MNENDANTKALICIMLSVPLGMLAGTTGMVWVLALMWVAVALAVVFAILGYLDK